MPDSDEVIRELEKSGAILRGHFQLSSGRHAEMYVEKFALLQWPDTTALICSPVVQAFSGQSSVVAGPTTGGVVLSYEFARQLGVRAAIAEKKEDGSPGREFRRGFKIGPEDRVLVVDDVLTTGGSIREVIAAVEEREAEVIGVGVLVDRTGGKVRFGELPFHAALTIEAVSWAPADCPVCARGEPLTVT